jgi:hypothetical protein
VAAPDGDADAAVAKLGGTSSRAARTNADKVLKRNLRSNGLLGVLRNMATTVLYKLS